MRSWILNRYLLVEVFPPLSMGLFVVTSTLLLILIVDVMDEVFLSGAPLGSVFKLLAFVFPTLLTMALPIGGLLATMLVYGRLVEDRELTAMRAAGMSGFSLVGPAYLLGILLMAFNFYWTSYITPKSINGVNQAAKQLLEQMTSINFFKPGQFNSPQEDLALYFSGMSPGTNTLEKVMIFKSGAEEGINWFGEGAGGEEVSDWTVWAPIATLNPIPSKGILQLVLRDCIVENLGNPEKISRVRIDQATVTIDIRYRLSKMSGGSLTRDAESLGTYLASARSQKEEYYRYLAHMLVPKGFPRGDEEALRKFGEKIAAKEERDPTPHGEVIALADELIKKELANPGYLEREHGFVSLTELRLIENRILGIQMDLNRAMQRVSYPAATFLFIMVGCPLGILMGRGKRTVCILVTVGILLIYYSLEKATETISETIALTSHFDPGFIIWLPNLLLLVTGLILLRVVSRY